MPTDGTPRARGTRRWLWAAVVLAGGPGASGQLALGGALFSGARPLAARIAGQDWELPQDAAACANCHQSGPSSFARPLTRATLTGALERRGGPPSVYDGATLCRALRDGIDPAWVVIAQTMPRYALTDEECRALWAFLSTRS